MQMDEGLDTGDMLLRTEVPIEADETGGSLHDKLAKAGAELCVETLKALEAGTLHPEKQGETPTRYARQLSKELGRIDWTEGRGFHRAACEGLKSLAPAPGLSGKERP